MDKKSVFQTNPPEEWREVTIHWLKTSQYYTLPWVRKFVAQLEVAGSDKEILSLKKKLEKFLKMLEEGEELPQDEIDEINRALLWGTIGIGGSGVATVEDAPEEPSGEPRPRELITQADFEAVTGVRLREPTTQEIKDALRIPSDFGYSGDLPIGETWSIGPVIRTRDSNIREQSNADALKRALKKIRQFDEEYQIVGANHWAVGWVDHLAFHAVDDDGEPTTIFRWLMGWNDNLENYSIADEEDYSSRLVEEQLKQIEDEAYRIKTGELVERFGDWDSVIQWLVNNQDEISHQTARFLEDPENYGVDRDDVEKALKALDMFKPEPKFEISLVTMQNDPYKVNVYTSEIDEALEEEEILGEEWMEDSGEVVAILDNSQDLPEQLEKEGYIVDKSEWFPPELPGQMSFSDREAFEEETYSLQLKKIKDIVDEILGYEFSSRYYINVFKWLKTNKTRLHNNSILFLEDPNRFDPEDDDIRRALRELDLYPSPEDEDEDEDEEFEYRDENELERMLPELLEDVPEYESPEDEVKANVIVKGSKEEAIQAAWDRGFKVEMDGPFITHPFDEIQFYVRGSLNDLVEWMNEPPHGAPYPAGSLLHYREIED